MNYIIEILFHELQGYIKSKKLLIGLSSIIFLIVISTIFNLRDYNKRYHDYQNDMQTKQAMIISIFRKPQLLSIFATGNDKHIESSTNIQQTRIDITSSRFIDSKNDDYLYNTAMVSSFDMAFVVKFVLSLFVIFFSYNIISEEKANGTLRLVLSNCIPRDNYIIGKFFAGFIVIFVSLIISFIISILIILLYNTTFLDVNELLRIFIMFIVSTIYLFFIYALSIFVSVITNKPFTSLLILVQLWFFMTILYPNIVVVIAQNTYNIHNKKEIRHVKREKVKNNNTDSNLIFDDKYRIAGAIFEYQVDREYINELNRQAKFTYNISSLSPALRFDYVMMTLAKTGIKEFEKYLDALLPFYERLNQEGIFDWCTGTDDSREYKVVTANQLAFNYYSEGIVESITNIIFDIGIIVIGAIILLTASIVMFLKKDVR